MTPSSTATLPRFPWRDAAIAVLLFVLTWTCFWSSPIVQMGDSQYSLLLTQSLITKGSFILDRYSLPRHTPIPRENGYVQDGDIYQLEVVDGHLYDYFPPGTAILSAPFVLVGDALGHSVFDGKGSYNFDQEASLQHLIASLLMAVLTVIFYCTARLLLASGWSACIALGGALGTQVWSTASRALWTHTWGIALLGTAILLLLAHETGRRRLPPVLLATLLSWTYFVRPTNSIFIVGITAYLLLFERKSFVAFAFTGALWFVGFVTYSWSQFGKLLPSYYQANRLEVSHFREALAGNLISPSRGALIYVPVTLFVVYLVVRYWRHLSHRRLVWLVIGTSVGQLAAVSCFNPWFGGWCYGPRYTTELVPSLVLLAVLGVRAALRARTEAAESSGVLAWRGTLIAGSLLLLVSVAINARGANSKPTARWNGQPVGLDYQPWRVWDWHHPQLLAGLQIPALPTVLPVLEGNHLTLGRDADKPFQLEGWSGSEGTFCWTGEHRATLVFATNNTAARLLRLDFLPYLHLPELSHQRIIIRLNDHPVADFLASQPDEREYTFPLPAGIVQKRNVLTFKLPDAASPESFHEGNDDRSLGIALHWLELDDALPPTVLPNASPVK